MFGMSCILFWSHIIRNVELLEWLMSVGVVCTCEFSNPAETSIHDSFIQDDEKQLRVCILDACGSAVLNISAPSHMDAVLCCNARQLKRALRGLKVALRGGQRGAFKRPL